MKLELKTEPKKEIVRTVISRLIWILVDYIDVLVD